MSYSLTAKDHTVSQETFDVWQCQECGLRFTQDVPRETGIGRYYESEAYISHSNTQQGLVNRLYHEVRNYTLRQKRKRVEAFSGKKQARILDIGCGTGEFLATMQQAGWTTLGLEPSESARTYARETHGLEVMPSDALPDLPNDGQDVISMWHVLEHVHQLHESMNHIHRVLAPDGRLLIAVPNYQSLDAEVYQAAWAAYDVPRHLYHFSPLSMKRLLDAHGFELNGMHAMPFDGFYVSLLSEKYVHGRLRLLPGFWTGLRSFLQMQRSVERGSAVLYVSTPKG